MNDFNLTITSYNENPWEQRQLESITQKLGTGKSKFTKFTKDSLHIFPILGSTSIIGYDDSYDYNGNFILTARVGINAGELYVYKGKVKISDNTIYIQSKKTSFLFPALQYNNVKKISFGTGQRLIKSSELKKFKICVPSSKEQDKIGKIFKIIEKIIALYERKTRLLGKLRTFLTQRLFSNSSKVSLYFDNKNWSKHKISEFLTERNEKVVPNSSIPLVSFTVEKGVTPKSKRYNREFLVKDDNKKYKITKKDDIVYNPANLKFGAIARNKFGNAAFSPIYVTFITKLNPAFTEFLVCRKDFINLALKYQEGTVYERMAVKSKDFLNLKIYLPNSSRDINHIAQILQSLDTLVSLNKNKVSLITLIKKELLNTMFI